MFPPGLYKHKKGRKRATRHIHTIFHKYASQTNFLFFVSSGWFLLPYAPITGLPQDGGAGQPTGIRLRKAHVGGDFNIHNGAQGGKFDSTAILKSGEDLGMSEWSAILENTQKSFQRVSRVQGWLNERCIVLLFLKQKCCFLCPSVLCL